MARRPTITNTGRRWNPADGTADRLGGGITKLHKKSGRPIKEIAADLGVTEQSLRSWVKQADIDAGRTHGLSSEEKEELRRLRREVRVLREEREILARAAAFFATENALPR